MQRHRRRLRADTSPGSPHVMLIVSPGKGIAMQYRAVANGTSATVAIVPGRAPAWVRLTRGGHGVIGEVSTDGVTWHVIGRVEVPLPGTARAGLAVTSHDAGDHATAVFDDIVLQPK